MGEIREREKRDRAGRDRLKWMMTLEELIASDPEPRELKRALAVKMRLQGMKHHQIQPVLGVHSSYTG